MNAADAVRHTHHSSLITSDESLPFEHVAAREAGREGRAVRDDDEDSLLPRVQFEQKFGDRLGGPLI
jgi:hypothetical protein